MSFIIVIEFIFHSPEYVLYYFVKMRQSEIFDAIFTYRKVEELQTFLKSHPNINFIEINDSQGNNVLHQLAYEGHLDLIKIFVY